MKPIMLLDGRPIPVSSRSRKLSKFFAMNPLGLQIQFAGTFGKFTLHSKFGSFFG